LVPVWRERGDTFCANLAQGGRIIPCPDKALEKKGLALARKLVKHSRIDLAAVDFLLRGSELLFNEINYVFGRQALGGSEAFYELWREAVKNFLKRV
jgi:ribosomal protein S6--L-glutamate ligase